MIDCVYSPLLLLWDNNLPDLPDLDTLGLKFLADILTTLTVVLFIYKPKKANADYVFTFLVFNILIFFLCILMAGMDVGTNFAFGLFALFSLLRYRTSSISIKDMTYLFCVICIAVFNSFDMADYIIEIIDGTLVVSMFALERWVFMDAPSSMQIHYENIELVRMDRLEELKEDLSKRTGFTIIGVEVESIDYLNDSARLIVYYRTVGDRHIIRN